MLVNKVFATPEFQALNCVDLSSIEVIPKSYEIYLSETFRFYCEICMVKKGTAFNCWHYHKLRLIDSYHFLDAPLADLGSELKSSCKSEADEMYEFAALWDYVQKQWNEETVERQKYIFQLLQRKQYFPYSYISSLDVLQESKLPNLEDWNKGFVLKNKATPEEVATAHAVFDELGCANIDEYFCHYLIVDILLLSAVYENWRRLGLEYFNLDMANYLSLPMFGMASWLYNNDEEISLLQDYESICFFENAKRGEKKCLFIHPYTYKING